MTKAIAGVERARDFLELMIAHFNFKMSEDKHEIGKMLTTESR